MMELRQGVGMFGNQEYSIEFVEPGRVTSTIVDFNSLDAAMSGAEKFRELFGGNDFIGIIKWDAKQAFPTCEWIVNKKGVLSPIFYASKSIH